MKKIASLLIAGVLVLAANHVVEAKGKSEQNSGSVISVGATPVPHAELLNLIKDDLAAKGITLKVVEFTDYVQPNVAVIAGDLDANFFQHIPYLETNAEWSSKLVSAFGVHVEPFGYTRQSTKRLPIYPMALPLPYPMILQTEDAPCFCFRQKGL